MLFAILKSLNSSSIYKRFLLFSILTILTWCSHSFAAPPLVITDVKKVYEVAPYSDFVESTAQGDAINKLWPRFRPFDYHQIKLNTDSSNVYWFRFVVRNETDQHVYITIPTLVFARMQLYEWTNGQTKLVGKGGNQYPINDKYLFTNEDIMPLSLAQNEQKTYLLRLSRFNSKSFPAFIYPEYALVKNSSRVNTLSGVLFGLIIAVMLYQLFIYLLTREPDFLRLSFYLLALCIQLTTYTGHYYEAFSFIPVQFNERFYFSITSIAPLLSYFFSYHFLEIHKQGDRFMNYGFRLFGVLFTITLLAAVLGLSSIAILYQNIVPAAAVFNMYVGIRLYSRGYRPALLYLIAYVVPSVTILYLSLYIYGAITYSSTIFNLILISYAAHAILFSIAVANKLIAYRKETERMIKAQNINLEQIVVDRTAELRQSLSDLKAAQGQLIQHEKMASLGKLTKGIMDRILNPLNYINNFSLTGQDLLAEMQTVTQKHQHTFPPDEQDDLDDAATMLKQNLTKIHEHGHSTARILQDMQKLLKERSSSYVQLDMNAYLPQQVNSSFQHALISHPPAAPIELEIKLSPQPIVVSLLPVEFKEVLDRLIDNSCYTLQEKSLKNTEFQPKLEVSTEVVDDRALIRIRDNGRGIRANELEQLFSPFFTTKPTAKGTGLSLYISKEVVEVNLQGQMEIDSVEDEYTRVTIILPLSPIALESQLEQ